MLNELTQRELRNDSGRIIRALDSGQSFILTRNGVPVGELSPVRRSRFVSASSALAMFRSAPRIDAERFRRDLDEITDQGITPRG